VCSSDLGDNPSREELIAHISEMNAEMLVLQDQLRQATDQSDWVADAMKARTRILNERVKELNCIYQVVQVSRNPDLRLEQRIGKIIDLLPRAWQHAEAACARAVLDSREFRTHKFRETEWSQKEPVLIKGYPRGTVEVCYLQACPSADEGPFLREERMLLKVVAECLGSICEFAGDA
jgi:hypothetical protein